jgi:DNA-binding XRE family transcriptional regulator
LGITQRRIIIKFLTNGGIQLKRKAFPVEICTFGEWLHVARKANHIKMRELAGILDVSLHQLSAWENDKRVPNKEQREQLCQSLGQVD